jgi:hypothetical protein
MSHINKLRLSQKALLLAILQHSLALPAFPALGSDVKIKFDVKKYRGILFP